MDIINYPSLYENIVFKCSLTKKIIIKNKRGEHMKPKTDTELINYFSKTRNLQKKHEKKLHNLHKTIQPIQQHVHDRFNKRS